MTQAAPDLFLTTFNSPLQELLVGALDRAYDAVADVHPTHPGFNERTFGFNVYELGVHELTALADENDELAVSWSGQAFRLLAGPFEIAYHKVGRTADDDIRTSFPNNDGAVTSMVLANYFPGFEPDLSAATRIVLAHMGNPQDGLCALYLCVPVAQTGGRISEWGFTYQVLRRGGDGSDEISPSGGLSDLPPDEVIEELHVSPRKADRKPRA